MPSIRPRAAGASPLAAGFLAAVLALSCASWRGAGTGLAGADRGSAILDAAGMPALPSSPLLRLSMDGAEWTERAIELARGARDYVLVCSFLLTEHPNALRVLDALAEAAARGVRVHLLVDSASYYRTYPMRPDPVPAAIARAKSLGLAVTEFNPIRGRRIFTLLGLLDRDHRKFWIVDGKLAVVGGQNIDADSLRPPSEGGCVDAMAEFASPGAVALLRDSFVASWNDWSVERLAAEDFSVAADPEPGDGEAVRVRVANQGPPGLPARVTPMFDALFEGAREEILLVECYTFLTPALLERVRRAEARGVRVRFVLSGGHLSPRFEKGSYWAMARLLEAGAEVSIWESPDNSLLHAKIILVDGSVASIGSANYNFRSQALSRELSVIFDDPASIALVRERLAELAPGMRSVDRAEAALYRGPDYLLNHLLMQLGG